MILNTTGDIRSGTDRVTRVRQEGKEDIDKRLMVDIRSVRSHI